MNIQAESRTTTRPFLVAVAAVGMLLFFFETQSFGQKEPFQVKRATSREGLIDTGFMTKADVSDDLDGSEDEYFYKFQAAPGKLTVMLEVKADETNAGAYLDLFGANNRPILQNILVQAVDRGIDRNSQSVNLVNKQDIIIRIKGIRYGSSGGYTGTYKILLEGTAVNFKDLLPSEGAVQVKKPDEDLSGETGQDETPAVTQPNGTGQEKKADEASPDKTGQNKTPDVSQSDGPGQEKKSTVAPGDETGKDKKPDPLDRAIEKGKKKSQKIITVLDRIKAKIPD